MVLAPTALLVLNGVASKEPVRSQIQEALDRCVQAAGAGDPGVFLHSGVAHLRPRLLSQYAQYLATGLLAPGLREVALEVQDIEEESWGHAARTTVTFTLGRRVALRIPFVVEKDCVRVDLFALQLLAYWGYEWRDEVERWQKQRNWFRRKWTPEPPPWPPREDAAWLVAGRMEESVHVLLDIPPEILAPLRRTIFELEDLEEYARILNRLEDRREKYVLSLIMALRGSRCALARALELLPEQPRISEFEDWFFAVSFPFSWPYLKAGEDFSEHEREVLRTFALKMEGEPEFVDVVCSKGKGFVAVEPWKDSPPQPVRIDKERGWWHGLAIGAGAGIALAALCYLTERLVRSALIRRK